MEETTVGHQRGSVSAAVFILSFPITDKPQPSSERKMSDASACPLEAAVAPPVVDQKLNTDGEAKTKTDISPTDQRITTTSDKSDSVNRNLVVGASTEVIHKGETNVAGANSVSGKFESIEESVQFILNDYLKVYDAIWLRGEKERFWKVLFVMPGSSAELEDVLVKLRSSGLGQFPGTAVSMTRTNIHFNSATKSAENVSKEGYEFDSLKARMIGYEVEETLKKNALITMDFLLLLTVASGLAAIGLLMNSSAVVVASMLVSPLLGPILAGIYGAIVKDKRFLWVLGAKNEVVALVWIILIGFVFGLIVVPLMIFLTESGYHPIGLPSGPSLFPTSEMSSRGTVQGFIAGIGVAILSAVGVQVAVLSENVSTMIGVAISASLLPPAVNAGILWASSFVVSLYSFRPRPNDTRGLEDCEELGKESCNYCRNPYVPVFDCDLAIECALLGAMSLLLVAVNIFCICIVGYGVCKLKEVRRPRIFEWVDSTAADAYWEDDLTRIRSYKSHHACNKGHRHNATLIEDVCTEALEELENDPEYMTLAKNRMIEQKIREDRFRRVSQSRMGRFGVTRLEPVGAAPDAVKNKRHSGEQETLIPLKKRD